MSRRDAGSEPAVAALARAAVASGQAALAVRDAAGALRWLDRAHRLVPNDPNVMLLLASACLDPDPGRAAGLFGSVAGRHDVRHAWLGLSAALLRAGAPAEAAAPLAVALSRHALSPDGAALADQVACVPGSPGWCGLTTDGKLHIHPAGAAGIAIQLDGKPLRGTALPADWARRRQVEVLINGRQALGSPIDIARIGRVVGCVEASEGGLRGWAWHPGDPDTPVVLTLSCPSMRHEQVIDAATETVDIPDTGPLARPRVFRLTRAALGPAGGLVHVRGPDGRDLLGSPLDPDADGAELDGAARRIALQYPAEVDPHGKHPVQARQARTRSAVAPVGRTELSGPVLRPMLRADAPVPAEPTGADRRRRATTVVIPVHNGAEVAIACLGSVLAATTDARLVVVDDGSTDPVLIAALDDLARRRRICLLRHGCALGFPASANAGIRAAAGRDIVLLNSDTLVPQGWLERLREAAYSARDIGSVTPFSNDASILSYPGPAGTNSGPDRAAAERLDRMAWRANGGAVVDIPVGVGFCLFIRRDCLNAVGLLRAEIFAQGYGEENDFCLRARRLGWRHVALPGLFVGHRGGASFDASAVHLRARNARIIEQLHPGHDALITRFLAEDPLAAARRRLDRTRWTAAGRPWRQATILITHNDGGGVERRVEQAARAHAAAGRRPIVLRPAETLNGEPAVSVSEGVANDFPNLIFAVPGELPALRRLLLAARPACVEVHHVLDHAPAIYDLVTSLDVPYDVHIHDYAWFCPRLSLVGLHDRYCGEPELPDCEACVIDLGHFLREDITVAALRQRSERFLSGARTIVTPSDDARSRIRRHFPKLSPKVVPHENDAAIPIARKPRRPVGRLLVCVVGGIGVHKGYDVLLACARDAVRRDLDIEFVVVGNTIDDARLLATGRIFITGRFNPDEAVDLIVAQRADLGFVPSIWPETWCLSLGEIWRAGLTAAAFDIGAPAERIRSTGRGFLLPLGLSPGAINNTLVVAGGVPFRA